MLLLQTDPQLWVRFRYHSYLLEGNLQGEVQGGEYLAPKLEIRTILCPDAEIMVLCGHPAHKAGAAALPSPQAIVSRGGLGSSGQRHHRPLSQDPAWRWRGCHQRRLGRLCLAFHPFTSVRCAELGAGQNGWGRTERWGRETSEPRRLAFSLDLFCSQMTNFVFLMS